VFFTNGGADAVENAIRMARLHASRQNPGRDTVLSTYRSYHGNTGAAIVATGDWRRMPNQYARGHVHFFGPYLYRSEFWATTPEEECERALHHLERVIQSEGPSTIAAVLLESVPGTAGILVPPPGYLAGVRELCDRYDLLLILDEVMCGFGRTGRWFAFDGYDVVPDLITFAKGVNSGYVPVGGVIISDPISTTFDDRVFPGGLTYSGHPLAAASIVASIDAMQDEGIVDNARRIGEEAIGPGLRTLAEGHRLIGEVRGEGVFWAMELVTDRETREPAGPDVIGRLKKELTARGLLPFTAENRIHVVPPCVVTAGEVDQAMSIYDEALTSVEADLV
jgi:adenosylmethionine-8-amino-7-oxononanoate aminotransferase